MPQDNDTTAPESATLVHLDDLWTIAVGKSKRHRRYVGGGEGERFATDGGQMIIIPEGEHEAAKGLGWGVMPAGDHWAEKSGRAKVSEHYLARPAEIATITHGLALRYGDCWLAWHYVDVALRFGGTIVRISGRTSEAHVPGVCVIMPVDMLDGEAPS